MVVAVTAINFTRRRGQQPFAVHNEHLGLGMLDLDAQRAHCLHRAQTIVA